MAKEREIKLRIENLPALRRALAKLGARVAVPRLHESNALFDTSGSALAKREQLLRIRTETKAQRKAGRGAERTVVTFKRPIRQAGPAKSKRHKVREEIEVQVSDAQRLGAIFAALQMRPWFHYEKFRTTFRLPAAQTWAKGLLLELDETPIGVFLELEGPAKAIDRAAQALGFRKSEYVLGNYMVLYREYCRRRREKPSDMLFAKKNGAHSAKSKIFS